MHKADTVQAFCWKARSLAVRHQPSSRKHRLNWHRGCRRRQVNADQLTDGWVNANTRILGPEVKYIIGRSSRGHITSDFDSSLETQQLVPIGRGKIYWVILGIKGLKQYWILKKFSYPVIPAVVDLILITVININQSSSQYRIYIETVNWKVIAAQKHILNVNETVKYYTFKLTDNSNWQNYWLVTLFTYRPVSDLSRVHFAAKFIYHLKSHSFPS